MIHCDHVNVFHKRGLNYHTINHTIIRVNGLIVTKKPLFPDGINNQCHIRPGEKCEEYSI